MSEFAAAMRQIDHAADGGIDSAFARYYPELKKIAHARIRMNGLQGQLQTTALVHDSYLKLAGGPEREFLTRLQFLAYASRTLRSVIVDLIREQRALRRGGDLDIVTLDTAAHDGLAGDVDIEAVNTALDDLAKLDAGLARLVEMRFFGGMTAPEIAEALGVSERTVQREWQKARALLRTMVDSG